MNRSFFILAGLAIAAASPVAAQDAPADQAVKVEAFGSTDADKTDILRIAGEFDFTYRGPEDYTGVRYERASYRPSGGRWFHDDRGFVTAARRNREAWSWTAAVGTEGHSVIGSVSVHDDKPMRKEFFVERDVVETPIGLTRRIYSTFVGGALDVPLSERDVVTGLVGLQEFSGRNERLHLRANYVHVLKPDWGLSAQLRTRYFHSSVPGEFDYYSPREYAQILPVLQLRRTTESGWRYLLVGGYGQQYDSASKWRDTRYLEARLTSPDDRKVRLNAQLLYTNMPADSGAVWDYLQGTVGLTMRF